MRRGRRKWQRSVEDVTARLQAALQADYVVLGGGNAKKLKHCPRGAPGRQPERLLGRLAHVGGSRPRICPASEVRGRPRHTTSVILRAHGRAPSPNPLPGGGERGTRFPGSPSVNITLAPPAIAARSQAQFHFLTTYLINDTIAIDAGSLGFLGDLRVQQRVRHILLSHTHLDHIASLPIFLENVAGAAPVTIHATEPVIECLQKDMFNGRLWPDFIALSRKGTPFLKLHPIHPGRAFELDGLKITPVAVNHVVPTCGFILEDAAAVVIAGDTGPTRRSFGIGPTLCLT